MHRAQHVARGRMTAAAVLALFTAAVRLKLGGPFSAHAIDDLGQASAAGFAASCAAWRAIRNSGRYRLSWAFLAAGIGSWTVGQLIWSYYELISTRETPFPSYADLGFLLFPVFCLPGLLLRPSAAFAGQGRARLLLDGLMVAVSLFSISWVTVLGQVFHSPSQSGLGLVVGLAYPIGDLVMITVGTLVVVQARKRAGLMLLICGLVGMALADSGFSYLTATGTYQTGSIVDFCWAGAFVLLGLAALTDDGSDSKPISRTVSAGYLALPYFLVLGGIAAAVHRIVKGDPLTLAVATIAILALLVRQLLTVVENRRLAMNNAEQREELRYLAFHDGLTGLANRALFADRINHALQLHQRDLRPVSLLFCDLDDFKTINDTLGHEAGDKVLTAVAERLLATTRTGDTVARLGGDEFGILLEDGGDPTDLSSRILASLTVPVSVGTRQVPVRASIGIATVSPDQAPAETNEVLKQADTAMYAAKRSGKSTCVVWSPALAQPAELDLDLNLELQDAIRTGGIGVAYQPIFFADGTLYAHEALARWRSRRAAVPPDVFIPMAERAGLLRELDMSVLGRALAFNRSQDRDPASNRGLISVNIGLSHLAAPNLVALIGEALKRHDVDPSRLIVEVPEDRAIDADEVLPVLRALTAMGVKLAIDDFGVGYSSLSRISALNPSVIKLDRSFVASLNVSERQADFVAGVVDLAHRLGTTVVAEGVETQEQLQVLIAMGCDAVQGYLLGRPQELDPAADRSAEVLANF